MSPPAPELPEAFSDSVRCFISAWWENTETQPEAYVPEGLSLAERAELLTLLRQTRCQCAWELAQIPYHFGLRRKKDGPRITIEGVLRKYCHPDEPGKRVRIFRELMIREIRIRLEAGEDPMLNEYTGRFQEEYLQPVINEVFGYVLRDFQRRFQVVLDDAGCEQVLGGRPGGQAVVLLGYDTQLDREVAIKRVRTAGDDDVRRLRREAMTLARLDTSVPDVYGVGFDADNFLCLAEQLIRGTGDAGSGVPVTTFACLMRRFHAAGGDARRRNPKFLDLIAKMIGVSRAVAAAHRHQFCILHRDLKPDNLLVDLNDQAFVIDWGMAVWLKKDDLKEKFEKRVVDLLTVITRGGGTPGYMSPEQAPLRTSGGSRLRFSRWSRLISWRRKRADREIPLSPSSDVFGLGACLFELITQHRVYDCKKSWIPFWSTRLRPVESKNSGASTTLIKRAQKYSYAPNPRAINPRADHELCHIVRRAINPDPKRRFEDAGQLAVALEDWLRDNPPNFPSRHWTRRVRATSGRWVRRNTGKFVLLILFVVFGLAIGSAVWAVEAFREELNARAAREREAKEKAAKEQEDTLRAKRKRAEEKQLEAVTAYSHLKELLDALNSTPGPAFIDAQHTHVVKRHVKHLTEKLHELIQKAAEAIALDPLRANVFLPFQVAEMRLQVASYCHANGSSQEASSILMLGIDALNATPDRPDPETALAAEMYWKLGTVEVACKRLDTAIEHYSQAERLWGQLGPVTVYRDRQVSSWHAQTLGYRGDAFLDRAVANPASAGVDFVAAENDYRQSREKRVEVLLKSGRADLRATAELAHAYNNLARLYRCKSQSGSSLSLYKVLSFNARGLALQFMTVRGRAAGASRVDYYTACTELGNTFSEIGDALLLAKYPAAAETAYRLAGNVFQAVNVDRPQADTILALANAQIGQLKSMLPRPNRNEKRIDDLVQNIDKHIKKLLGQGVDLAYLSKTKDAFADSLKLRSLPAPN